MKDETKEEKPSRWQRFREIVGEPWLFILTHINLGLSLGMGTYLAAKGSWTSAIGWWCAAMAYFQVSGLISRNKTTAESLKMVNVCWEKAEIRCRRLAEELSRMSAERLKHEEADVNKQEG